MRSFPQMPEEFADRIAQEVEWQCRKQQRAARPAFKRVLIIAAVVLTLAAATTVVAKELKLFPLLNSANANAAAMIQEDVVSSAAPAQRDGEAASGIPIESEPDADALLTVDEVLFDGVNLMVYASPTAHGEGKDIYVRDHIYINGQVVEAPCATYYPNHTDGRGYMFEVYVEDLQLTQDFEVMLPVCVSGNMPEMSTPLDPDQPDPPPTFGIAQELTFTVAATVEAVSVPAQTIEGDGFTVEVTRLTFSPTATILRYNVTYDDWQLGEDKLEDLSCLIQVDNGEEKFLSGLWGNGRGASAAPPVKNADGSYYIEAEHSLRAFDRVTGRLTVTPYEWKDADDGGDGTEAILYPEYSFTIEW